MKIAVIGAGISGLSAAYYLNSLSKDESFDIEIDIFEKSGQAGGNISTKIENGFVIEEGADSFITSKPWGIDLCEKLGIEEQLISTNDSNRKTYIYFDQKLNELPEGFFLMAPSNIEAFEKSTFFSTEGKKRILKELELDPLIDDGDESLESFILRRFGTELLEKVAQPLIGGIYTGDLAKLSVKAILPEFVDFEKQYGSVIKGISKKYGSSDISKTESGARYGLFVSFKNGLSVLISSIIKAMPDVNIHYNSSVNEVLKSKDTWLLHTESGCEIETDAVIMAGPSFVSSKLLSNTDKKLSGLLNEIRYESSIVVNLVFEKSKSADLPKGFGVVIPNTEKMNLIACSFSSHKFSNRAPKDYEIIRCFLGGAFNQNVLDLKDSEIMKLVLEDLNTLFNIESEPINSFIYRYPNSMPQYTLGYNELLDKISEELRKYPLLSLSGNAYGGIGIPDSIKSGKDAARYIFQNLVT